MNKLLKKIHLRKRTRHKDADMTQGIIWRQLLEFSLPMMLGMLFQQFYNTVDTIVVGQFVGKEALAAVGSTGSIINMLVGLANGLAMGATVTISQCYGAHDFKKLRDAVQTTVVLTFIMCVVASVAGVFIVTPMLHFMDTPAAVFDSAKQYLTIYFAGITGLLIYNMGSGILRAVGDSTRPLYFLVTSALLNIVFDLIFVLGFKMGVAGVAWATVLAQCISAVLVLYSLSHSDAPYAIRWHELGIKKEMLKRVLSIGLPTSIQQALTSFSNVFVQSYINCFGSACMAGWSSYNKLDSFVLLPMQAIALASTTFVGQNFGAKQYGRMRKGVHQALGMSLLVSALLGAVAMIFARPLMMLFTTEPEVLDYGVGFVQLITPFYLLCVLNQIYAGALRGVGNSTAPTIIMLTSFVAFRQVYLFANKTFFGNTLNGMALGYPMGWILCSLLMMLLYYTRPIFRKKDQPDLVNNA